MTQFYVEAKSKKAVNEALTKGEVVCGYNYSMFDGDSVVPSTQWKHGDVIKVFSKRINGTPYAKAYGTVSIRDNVVRVK